MKSIVTTGIVLARINYGEADRIITVLTPDQGKLRLIAKGTRRVKSKLAGGIELFSTSQLTFAPGRGEIGTLVSSRLDKHYGTIVNNLERTLFGYELLKLFNRSTEDLPEPAYYELLATVLEALDDATVPSEYIRLWIRLQLLKLAGHSPDLRTDKQGQKLVTDSSYSFNVEDMQFSPQKDGVWAASHIKLLRLAHGLPNPAPLNLINDIDSVLPPTVRLVELISQQYLRA